MGQSIATTPDFEVPAVIQKVQHLYEVRPGVTFLNHGSFGFRPKPVLNSKRIWADMMEQQPMDFFVRTHRAAIENVVSRLSNFLKTTSDRLILCHNATEAMNALAYHLKLESGDEVVLNNHEYGAVTKTWQRKCNEVGAKVVEANISLPVNHADQIVNPIIDSITDKTRLVVLSHITSPTAIRFPVERLIREIQGKGVPVCIDGPHAIAQLDLDLESLGADFYTASCHKWLAGPVGTGFLYVKDPVKDCVAPMVESWGLLPPENPEKWTERFVWQGTSDPTGYLGLPAAIDFLQGIGLQEVRSYCHQFAVWTKKYLEAQWEQDEVVPSDPDWMTSMALVRLPKGDWSNLQNDLWKLFQIEVPIIQFEDEYYVRVSCYLYNRPEQIVYLNESVNKLRNGS